MYISPATKSNLVVMFTSPALKYTWLLIPTIPAGISSTGKFGTSHDVLPRHGSRFRISRFLLLAVGKLPWSQRFFLIFRRERDQEQAAKRRQRVAKATRRERKTSGYLGLESHFHADDRVRIWPSGVDWLIFFQTRKPIWLACLIVTTEGTLRIFTPHFWR